MSGDMLFGKCACCGKEKPLQRTYFRYPIECQCHNRTHFDLIDHCADCTPKSPKETRVLLTPEQIDEIAHLREENDLQRHSIQQLSAQVAGLREALSVIRNNPDLWKRPKIGGQDKYAGMPPLVRKIDSILAQPDPGAEIMERMKKLEAVAEAAREVEKFIFPIKGENLVKVIGSDINKLVQALAALEGVTPCTT